MKKIDLRGKVKLLHKIQRWRNEKIVGFDQKATKSFLMAEQEQGLTTNWINNFYQKDVSK